MFLLSNRRNLVQRRTTLSLESLEVRAMLTSAPINFALIGDYGTDLAFENGLSRIINRESDPNFPAVSAVHAKYEPEPDALQDFILGAGDARYNTGLPPEKDPTYQSVHGNFCNYLAGVSVTECTSAYGFSVDGGDLSNGRAPAGVADSLNTGSATVSDAQVVNEMNANLFNTVEIRFNTPASTYDVVDTTLDVNIASGVAYSAGSAIHFNGGSVVVDGAPNAGDKFFVRGNASRFFPAAGNHDYLDGGGISEFTDYFSLPGNRLYYDVEQGMGTDGKPLVHVFVLDSQAMVTNFSGNVASVERQLQRDWLQAGLATSDAHWQVVLLHHSPYTSTSRKPNTALQFPFAEWGVDLVVSGHEHAYERIERSGTTFIVNGSSGTAFSSSRLVTPEIVGSKAYNGVVQGAVFFTADEDSLEGKFKTILDVVSPTEQYTDSFSVQRATKGTPFVLSCDYVGNEDGCDIDDLDQLYADMAADSLASDQKKDMIHEWLDLASSGINQAKGNYSHVYVVGDTDLNGTVDELDLGILLNNFLTTSPFGWGAGDFDADDDVDSSDLGILLNGFRHTS